ncbi:MerR family DNA-binding protein [Dokdonella sp.]|uniref:MerR family DNA-binding protein n=1 Tax=Dokdonella sp. TaxID=2291710 RepID=UPI003527B1E3
MNKFRPHIRKNASSMARKPRELMTVSRLASFADEPAHAVRYYCRIGLLVPATTSASGYRLFDQGSLRRLRFIRRAQGLGFTLDEIAAFIRSADAGSEPCEEVMEILDQRLPKIGAELDKLVLLHARMSKAQQRWRESHRGTPSGFEICRLIESEGDTSIRRSSPTGEEQVGQAEDSS